MKNMSDKERKINLRISKDLFDSYDHRDFLSPGYLIPPYTTHIEDAWKVVTQMGLLGWLITIHADKTPDQDDGFWIVEFFNENPVNDKCCYEESNTILTLAICESSLKVLDGEKRIGLANNL